MDNEQTLAVARRTAGARAGRHATISTMAKLYEIIKHWADGQNALNAAEIARAAALQKIVHQALPRLQRHSSLADLASAYYADEDWWPLVAQEFELGQRDAHIVRNAAYWQRLMQIRHPSRARSR